MTNAEITIIDNTESSGTANIDTESLTVGSKTVQRQRIQLAGSTDVQIASIINTAPVSQYGIVTRNIPSGTQTISGDVAHDTLDSGNPMKIGGKARTSLGIAVAHDDRVDAVFDKVGRQVVVLSSVRELVSSATNAAAITGTTETTIIPAVASEYHDLLAIIITNSSTIPTLIQIRDTTGGTVIMNVYSMAGTTTIIPIALAPIPQTTVNTNWTAQAVTLSSSLFIMMQYTKNI